MLTEREGVAGIALLAMYADGVIAAEEDDVLRERLLRYPDVFGGSDDELGRMLSRVEKLGEEIGPAKLMDACIAAVKGPMRASAYRIAAEIVVADHDLAPEEDEYLEVLRDGLGISADEADRIHAQVEAAA